ncbi:MAG: AraC family transcriptional regulator [Lachnospiraceae bacterium]|nr:AraC family transcriptional regulator [Lachnospiraceae bacterium]
MNLFEESDLINNPFRCFYYDSESRDFPVKLHYHYYMEIAILLEGECLMTTNDKTYTLKQGDMIIFHPNVVHGVFPTDDYNGIIKYAVFKLDINRMNLTSTYSPKLRSIFKSIENSNYSPVIPKEYADKIYAKNVFEMCINEYNKRLYSYETLIQATIYALLIEIVRYYQDLGYVIDNDTYAEDGRYDIFCITDYIDNHIHENIKIQDIAKASGMSYSYFAKKFQSVYGKSCKEYIDQMRLFKVEELLMFTDFDLTYIANECGYSDCSHLINSFKKSKGITPKHFRKAHAKKS